MKHLFLLIIIGITFCTGTLPTDCPCETDYFLSWNQDHRRCLNKDKPHDLSIENCIEYTYGSKGLECTKCAPTHAIGKAKECHFHNITDCISAQIDPSTNFGQPYTFKCQECGNGKVLDIPTKTCVANTTTPIANCEKHIKDTTYKCIKCNANTYLKAASTSPQANCDSKNTITNCINYNKISDQAGFNCTACNQTTGTPLLLQPDGMQCHAQVNITGCSQYKHDGTNILCKTCNANMTKWSGENGCTTTPTNIANCTKYATPDGSSWTCSECAPGTVPHFNERSCQDPSSQTTLKCQIFQQAAPWLCKQCQSSFPILQTNKKQCHAIPQKNTTSPQAWWTDNCYYWIHDNTKYSCHKCNLHYFRNTVGTHPKCQKTERKINNCKSFSDLYTCEACIIGFSLNKNTCIPCPARKYVPPTPCPLISNSTNTNTTVSNTTGKGNNGKGKNSSITLLKYSIQLLVVLVIALQYIQ